MNSSRNTPTREQILLTLKERGHASIAELVEALGISHVSVRHHLSSFQAEGLVASTEVRRGVGRPHLAYTLTEAALERFPTKYVRLSERLLDELKTVLPQDAIEAMFGRMVEGMVADYRTRLEGKSLEEKMALLVEVLGTEGFMARWNTTGESIALYNCPYFRIGQRHPEVCAIDQSLISQVLSADVEKTTCMLNGAEHCVFVISPAKSAPITLE